MSRIKDGCWLAFDLAALAVASVISVATGETCFVEDCTEDINARIKAINDATKAKTNKKAEDADANPNVEVEEQEEHPWGD